MTQDDHPPTLVTHSGKFHCDDVFGYMVLRLALGISAPGHDHVLIRTRKPEPISSATIVWDVGTVYDAAANRFDHHQRGSPLRPDGTPFSSAGLIWQVYGERAVTALLRDIQPDGAAAGFAASIAAELDALWIRRIDEIDNGVSVRGEVRDDTLHFSSLVGEFNPNWDSADANGPTAGDQAFLLAAEFAQDVLRRRVDSLRARLAAEQIVLQSHAAGGDTRVLVLEQGMPWKSAVFNHSLPVLFTVSPSSSGDWVIDTVPPEPGSFAQRLPLPEDWAGLQEEELAAKSGVKDAVFVHLRRFVGSARSRAGALAMVEKALACAE